jgi:hypothetical protein
MGSLQWVTLLIAAAGSTGCQIVAGVEDRVTDPIVSVPDTGPSPEAAGIGDAGSEEAAPGIGDAGSEEAAPSGPWDCVSLPNEPLDPSLQVMARVQIFDAAQTSITAGFVDGGSDLDTVSATWLPGVVVRACDLRQPDCPHPYSTATTDDGGTAVFQLTGAFAGFFALTGPDMVPFTFYPGNLLAGHTSANLPSYGISPENFTLLASTVTSSQLNLSPDAGVGHTFVNVYDCQDHQAPGVTLTYSNATAGTVVFYMKGGYPNTMVTTTDSYGIGGAINMPIGNLTVRATLASNLMPLGSADVLIRPGQLTNVWIRVRSH